MCVCMCMCVGISNLPAVSQVKLRKADTHHWQVTDMVTDTRSDFMVESVWR